MSSVTAHLFIRDLSINLIKVKAAQFWKRVNLFTQNRQPSSHFQWNRTNRHSQSVFKNLKFSLTSSVVVMYTDTQNEMEVLCFLLKSSLCKRVLIYTPLHNFKLSVKNWDQFHFLLLCCLIGNFTSLEQATCFKPVDWRQLLLKNDKESTTPFDQSC